MATYRAPKVVLPIFNPLVYPTEESATEDTSLVLAGYTFTALYQYPQPNPITDLIFPKWETIASSADCSVLYIPEGNIYDANDKGYIYLTNSGSPPNDGSAFTPRAVTIRNYIGVACSADGTRGVTSGSSAGVIRNIRWTSDSGVTWNTYTTTITNFTCFACSSLGLIMYAGSLNGGLFKSTNGGSSWTNLGSAGDLRWSGMACVPDGSIVYACVGDLIGVTTGYVWKSTDGGSNWTQLICPQTVYSSISCDSTGQIVIAGAREVTTDRVFVSTNGGSSWTPTSLPTGEYNGVKCSPDGTKLFACSYSAGGKLYYSLNLGVTWTDTGIVRYWTGVTCNTDGTVVYAVDNMDSSNGGNVWRGFPFYTTA